MSLYDTTKDDIKTMNYTIEHLNQEYQEFSFFTTEKTPGFNEMVTAAKSFGEIRKIGKAYNAYAKMKNLWSSRLVYSIEKNKIYPVDKVYLYMLWIEPNTRRDPDNIAAFSKFILDALQKASIIKNDGWKNITGFTHGFKRIKDRRGVIVRLYNEINKR